MYAIGLKKLGGSERIMIINYFRHELFRAAMSRQRISLVYLHCMYIDTLNSMYIVREIKSVITDILKLSQIIIFL